MSMHPLEEDGLVDVPEYQNLDLLDYGGEADLLGAALARLETSLPEWDARVGSTEFLLLESLAMMLGVEVMALQMVSSQIVEQLMGLYGVARDPGRGAEAQTIVTVSGSQPIHEIPVGTRLRYEMHDTDESYDLLTTESIEVVTANGLTALVRVGAELVGTELNGLPAGTPLQVVDTLPFIESVVLHTDLAGGRGQEEDDSFFARATAKLSTLNSTLVLPGDFQYAARTIPGVGRTLVLNLHDPAAPDVETPGHISLAVADIEGEPISEDLKDLVLNTLKDQALASLELHVIDPAYTTVDVSVKVQRAAGYLPEDVEAVVEAKIRDWVNPKTWEWAPTVDQYALIAVIGSLPHVAMVVEASPTVPLSGKAPLPRLGAVNVEVV